MFQPFFHAAQPHQFILDFLVMADQFVSGHAVAAFQPADLIQPVLHGFASFRIEAFAFQRVTKLDPHFFRFVIGSGQPLCKRLVFGIDLFNQPQRIGSVTQFADGAFFAATSSHFFIGASYGTVNAFGVGEAVLFICKPVRLPHFNRRCIQFLHTRFQISLPFGALGILLAER